MNSLLNQQEICRVYAEQRRYQIVGRSSDDNVSGMKFSRRGLDEFTAAVDTGRLDGVLVKDLSRLGRHRTQTALFIDYLRERGVRVISVTEGLDTASDEDDLVIGVRGLMNDYYAKDIGQKIRSGYRQKQKEGLVVIPPFGYRKDKNTDSIEIVEEAADTVRRIYQLYLEGMTLMPISRILNQEQRKTPARMQAEFYGKHTPNVRQYLWCYTSVKNILQDESYTGVLCNHQQETKDGKRLRRVPTEEQFRHENVYPPIISKEDWTRAQTLLQKQCRKRTNSNAPCHRYAGLLACGDCGAPFVAVNRSWNGKCRVEYICKTYMRHGKAVCASHRIREERLDAAVREYAETVRRQCAEDLKHLMHIQKMWALRKPILDAHISMLKKKVTDLEYELDALLIEQIKAGRPSS
jgi:DNA invertase Pin-like site-specific DNA recombinase